MIFLKNSSVIVERQQSLGVCGCSMVAGKKLNKISISGAGLLPDRTLLFFTLLEECIG